MAGSPRGWPIYRAAFREAGRKAGATLRGLPAALRLRARAPTRLVLAPQDLRTSDPITAEDLAAGLFVFAGRTVQAGATSPFAVIPPSVGWAEALYGFAWLRHLREAEDGALAGRGRAIVAEAIGPRRRELGRGPARRTEVVARRVISLLGQSPLLLAGADHDFWTRYLAAIGRGARQLGRDMNRASRPRARLSAAIALAYAGLCCEGLESELSRASRALARELDAQLLPDGGPLSRNPGDLVELLLDLLPLRLLFEGRSVEPPAALERAVERALPMLRFFRHPDGELALFNGMGRTPLDTLATVLSHDDVRELLPAEAIASGYQRLEAGGTVLLVECGPPPPLEAAAAAHAGCLSLELSCGPARVIVNCGAPAIEGPLREAARGSAAHSTLAIGQESSARFLAAQGPGSSSPAIRYLLGAFGPALAEGPTKVETARRLEEDGHQRLAARHDGYVAAFGLMHERRLRLSPDGRRLEGVDALRPEAGRRRAGIPPATLRFHLSPGARAAEAAEGVEIALPDGQTWRFTCEAAAPTVEPSISFAVPEGRRAAQQVVVPLPVPAEGRDMAVAWSLERIG